jgi:hypothetical protein
MKVVGNPETTLEHWCSSESNIRRLRFKCDGTCAETKFRLSPKRTSPFKSAGASVQSTTGSRGVRISVSNVGYTTFRGYWLSTPFASFPFTSPPVHHRVPSGFKRTLQVVRTTQRTQRVSVSKTKRLMGKWLVFIVGIVETGNNTFLTVGVGDIYIYHRNLTGDLRTDVVLLSYRLWTL